MIVIEWPNMHRKHTKFFLYSRTPLSLALLLFRRTFPPECPFTTTKKACSNLPGCKGKKRKNKSEPYCKKKSCNLTQHKGQLPAAKDDLSIYWRLARPELVRKWQSAPGGKQVSSDAFSRFAGEVLARLVPKVSAWSE